MHARQLVFRWPLATSVEDDNGSKELALVVLRVFLWWTKLVFSVPAQRTTCINLLAMSFLTESAVSILVHGCVQSCEGQEQPTILGDSCIQKTPYHDCFTTQSSVNYFSFSWRRPKWPNVLIYLTLVLRILPKKLTCLLSTALSTTSCESSSTELLSSSLHKV